MRKPENCIIEYCGYKKPFAPQEIQFEILGLETALAMIQKRIADLKQSDYLAQQMFAQQVSDAMDDNENLEEIPRK